MVGIRVFASAVRLVVVSKASFGPTGGVEPPHATSVALQTKPVKIERSGIRDVT
jgi:hypothetical protein